MPDLVQHLNQLILCMQLLHAALSFVGYETIDYNEEDEGFSLIQTTTNSKGRRVDAATAFLYPIADR